MVTRQLQTIRLQLSLNKKSATSAMTTVWLIQLIWVTLALVTGMNSNKLEKLSFTKRFYSKRFFDFTHEQIVQGRYKPKIIGALINFFEGERLSHLCPKNILTAPKKQLI